MNLTEIAAELYQKQAKEIFEKISQHPKGFELIYKLEEFGMRLPRIITSSSLSNFKVCPRKFYLENVLLLDPQDSNLGANLSALEIGKVFHSFFLPEFQNLQFEDMESYNQQFAWVLYKAYEEIQYSDDEKFNEEYKVEFEYIWKEKTIGIDLGNVIYAGVIDGLGELKNGRKILIEHKTASSGYEIQYAEPFNNSQIVGYVWMLNQMEIDVDLILIDVVIKPRIYKRKGEEMREYLKRIYKKLIIDKDKHFLRVLVRVTKEDLINFEKELRNWLFLMSWNLFPRNDTACFRYGKCPFFKVCSGEIDVREIRRKDDVNPELNLEELEIFPYRNLNGGSNEN